MKEQVQEGQIKKVVVIGENSLISEVSSVLSALGYSSRLISLPLLPQARSPKFATEIDELKVKLNELFNKIDSITNKNDILSVVFVLNNHALACLSYDIIDYERWNNLLKLMKETPSLVLCHEDTLTSGTKIRNYITRLYDIENREFTLTVVHERGLEPDDLTFIPGRWSSSRVGISSDLRSTTVQTSGRNLRKFLTSITDDLLDRNDLVKKISQLREAQDFKLILDNFTKMKNNHIHRAIEFLEFLGSEKIEIASYGGNFEIGVRIQQFLEEIEQGIFLRLYVPYGRYQAEQLESFLRLIESYLQQVEKIQFFIDRKKQGKEPFTYTKAKVK